MGELVKAVYITEAEDREMRSLCEQSPIELMDACEKVAMYANLYGDDDSTEDQLWHDLLLSLQQQQQHTQHPTSPTPQQATSTTNTTSPTPHQATSTTTTTSPTPHQATSTTTTTSPTPQSGNQLLHRDPAPNRAVRSALRHGGCPLRR